MNSSFQWGCTHEVEPSDIFVGPDGTTNWSTRQIVHYLEMYTKVRLYFIWNWVDCLYVHINVDSSCRLIGANIGFWHFWKTEECSPVLSLNSHFFWKIKKISTFILSLFHPWEILNANGQLPTMSHWGKIFHGAFLLNLCVFNFFKK